jgi:metallopeptidase MepB
MASNQFDSQASTNYKEAFALFDKRGNGRVTTESLGDLLRACGQNPTLAEIQDLEKNVGGDCMWRPSNPPFSPYSVEAASGGAHDG